MPSAIDVIRRKISSQHEGEYTIHVGRFTVAPFPEDSPHHGAIFEVSADIVKLQAGRSLIHWHYSVGWSGYEISGSERIFDKAWKKACEELWEMYRNWYLRGDDPTTIIWHPEGRHEA